MILIIDNYDSFTQNLLQCVGTLNQPVIHKRNDLISIEEIDQIQPSHIILSPGPGHPKDSKICLDIIKCYAPKIPILGICLGHQSIGHIYGAAIKALTFPTHGKISNIIHNQKDLFDNLPLPFSATRYHSLVIDEKNIPKNLEVTAWTQEGLIMACKHKQYNLLRGIQFHPESLWTPCGQTIIKNFIFQEL
uniref:Anthranilate synthase component 2 n=1 Tax=Crouania attenuata TaxID=42002 RepID=A0A4D6WP96_9FLOR|nr:Anthranilate synthase component II [Crouania attenuata]